MKKTTPQSQTIRVSGGGSKSDLICQITADIFNVPVQRVQTYETFSLGGAMALFLSKGIFKDIEEATENMVHVKDEFIPDPEANEKYEYLYNKVYVNLYPTLKKTYKRTRKI